MPHDPIRANHGNHLTRVQFSSLDTVAFPDDVLLVRWHFKSPTAALSSFALLPDFFFFFTESVSSLDS